jgi:23S rRNA pseudouridine2605 synthase
MALRRNNKDEGKAKKAPFKKVTPKKSAVPDSPFKQFYKEKPADKALDNAYFEKEYKPRKDKDQSDGSRPFSKGKTNYKTSGSSRFGESHFDRKNDFHDTTEKKDYSAKPPVRFTKKSEENTSFKKFDERDSRPPFMSEHKNSKQSDAPFERKERSFDRKNEFSDNSKFEAKNETGTKKKLFNDDYFLGKGDRPYGAKSQERFDTNEDRPRFEKREDFDKKDDRPRFERRENFEGKDDRPRFEKKNYDTKSFGNRNEDPRDSKRPTVKKEDEITRLNKYVAQSGLCSRRKAAELVKAGEIWVNGVVELNPAYETKPTDIITHKSIVLKKEEKMLYVLMNKPKNTITTAEDEKGRKTVLDLIKNRYDARLFPVGRLDRNTTGLLLLTNDGDLAKKLSHPSHQVKKVYIVETDINVKTSDIDKIKEGIVLDDGVAEVDACDYIEGGKKNEIGIEIHSGKNRIVRRIFESLGYEVVKLDRTYYGGLTKKDLPRGFTRELTDKEIIMLRHFTNHRKKE